MYHISKKYSAGTEVARNVLPCPQPQGGNVGFDWLLIKVSNTSNTAKQVALFDASGKGAIKAGIRDGEGISIEGINVPYDVVLNDLASTEQYCVDMVRTEVPAGQESQLENNWQILEDVPFSNSVNLLKDIYPSTFKDPYQQQGNRLDVKQAFTITRNTLMKVNMNANSTQFFRLRLRRVVLNG